MRIEATSIRSLQRLSAMLLLVLCLLGGQFSLVQHDLDHAPGAEAVCLQCAHLGDRTSLLAEIHLARSDRLHEHPWISAAVALSEPEAPARRARAPPSLLS